MTQNRRRIGVVCSDRVTELIAREMHDVERNYFKTVFYPSVPMQRREGLFYVKGCIGDTELALVNMHGPGHCFEASDAPYKAVVHLLHDLKVEAVVQISTVGSLKHNIQSGHMVVVDMFFDRTSDTKSQRTFFDEPGLVVHVNFGQQVCHYLRTALFSAANTELVSRGEDCSHVVHNGGGYVCIQGPQYSTEGDSIDNNEQADRSVVGMTALRLARLLREVAIPFAVLASVTDMDAWAGTEVTGDEVARTAQANAEFSAAVIARLANGLLPSQYTDENPYIKGAVHTKHGAIWPGVAENRFWIRPFQAWFKSQRIT